MAKPNYQFEKRKKDLERKKKQDEKRQRKAEKAQGKAPGDEFGEPQTPMPGDGTPGTEGNDGTAGNDDGAPAV